MTTKEEMFAAGVALAQEFCLLNGIVMPAVRRVRPDERDHNLGTCAYYRPTRINIMVEKCANRGFGGRAWSWPVSIRDVLREPPTDLFTVKRVGNQLEFTTYPVAIATMRNELLAWLETQTITRENIGAIRTSCFVPWDSEWNGFVRDETAKREKPAE